MVIRYNTGVEGWSLGEDVMLNTQEHIDLVAQFERDIQRQFRVQLAKEAKEMWPQGHVYCHAETNSMFLAYRFGYAYGKAIGRIGSDG